jgi:serine/threonine-protein kinase
MVGNVLGTPAYMAPEQAQGEIQKLDERSDVFALGAILCEILTGAPPYVAGEGQNLLQKAALAELDDARARIDATSAPAELKKLCLACLLPTRQARPGSAEEVARSIHEHLAGLESAAHRAELAAAEERLRAERSRRRQQLTLLVGGALLLAGATWWWIDAQRRVRHVELERGFDEVRSQVAAEERDGNLDRALEAAKGGQRMVEAGDADRALFEEAQALVASTEVRWEEDRARREAKARETELLEFLTDAQMRQANTGVTETDEDVAAEYRRAFQGYGIVLDDPALGPRLLALRDTELGIRLALGFDGWARVLRRLPNAPEADVELLTGVGLDLDTDHSKRMGKRASATA